MHMRVDPAGDHDLPRGVDGPSGADRGEGAASADRRDMFAVHPDIGRLGTRGKDGGTAGDDDVEHLGLL